MAGIRNLLLSRSLTATVPKVLRKHISSTAMKSAYLTDVCNPASAERVTQPLSDALAAKEKGSWSQLNNEDKIALYRSSFPLTFVEGSGPEPDLARVLFGVTVGVSVAIAFFAFFKEYVGPQAPRTITQEWRDAEVEKMKLYNINPITGAASKK